MSSVTVSSKGWVVIPAELRKKYALKAGSHVILVDYGGVISIVPALSDPVEGSVRILDSHPSLTEALLREHAEERKTEG